MTNGSRYSKSNKESDRAVGIGRTSIYPERSRLSRADCGASVIHQGDLQDGLESYCGTCGWVKADLLVSRKPMGMPMDKHLQADLSSKLEKQIYSKKEVRFKWASTPTDESPSMSPS